MCHAFGDPSRLISILLVSPRKHENPLESGSRLFHAFGVGTDPYGTLARTSPARMAHGRNAIDRSPPRHSGRSIKLLGAAPIRLLFEGSTTMRIRALRWCSVLALAFVAVGRLAAQTDVDREAARNVAEILADEHFTKKPIDKNLSAVWLKLMLRQLDSMKSYFQKSDVAEFEKRKDDYAEFLHKGDFEPALAIHHKIQERFKERLATIRQLLKEDLDPKNEALAPMPAFDKATWPATDAEVRATWRKRLRYEMLVLKAEGYSAKDAANVLERRYVRLGGLFAGLTDAQAAEAAINILAASYDSRSTYQSEATIKKYSPQTRKQYQGVGIEIREREGAVVITKITPKGPADLDGKLRPGDTIVGVDPDATGKMRDVIGASAAEVSELLARRARLQRCASRSCRPARENARSSNSVAAKSTSHALAAKSSRSRARIGRFASATSSFRPSSSRSATRDECTAARMTFSTCSNGRTPAFSNRRSTSSCSTCGSRKEGRSASMRSSTCSSKIGVPSTPRRKRTDRSST